jgi:hypothetical protein
VFAGRQYEKQKRIGELQSNFHNELIHRQQLMDSDHEVKLTEFTENCQKEQPEANESAMHSLSMNKTKARFDFVNRQITLLHEEHKAKMIALSSEISGLAKAKRQFERRKKKETQNIDDEFEMNIQIEQVHLRNMIENLAKLYDKEENERGCQIIEAIRQVREAHNRTDDLLFRGRNELNALKQSFVKSCSHHRIELGYIESGGKEKDLLQKIEQQKSIMAVRLSDIETRMHRVKESLAQSRAKQNAIDQTAILSIQSLISADTSGHATKCQLIQEEKTMVVAQERAEMDRITLEFQERREKSIFKHKTNVQAHQQRISSAVKQRDELAKQFTAEQEQLQLQNHAILEQRRRDNPHLQAKSSDLSTGLLSKSVNSAEIPHWAHTPSMGNRHKIDSLLSQIQSLDAMTESAFESFFVAIKNGPTDTQKARQISPPEHDSVRSRSSRSARNPNNSVSRGSRPDSSRPYVPVEPKFRRRTPILTAQYMEIFV